MSKLQILDNSFDKITKQKMSKQPTLGRNLFPSSHSILFKRLVFPSEREKNMNRQKSMIHTQEKKK